MPIKLVITKSFLSAATVKTAVLVSTVVVIELVVLTAVKMKSVHPAVAVGQENSQSLTQSESMSYDSNPDESTPVAQILPDSSDSSSSKITDAQTSRNPIENDITQSITDSYDTNDTNQTANQAIIDLMQSVLIPKQFPPRTPFRP